MMSIEFLGRDLVEKEPHIAAMTHLFAETMEANDALTQRRCFPEFFANAALAVENFGDLAMGSLCLQGVERQQGVLQADGFLRRFGGLDRPLSRNGAQEMTHHRQSTIRKPIKRDDRLQKVARPRRSRNKDLETATPMIEKKMRAIQRVPTNYAVRNIPPAKGRGRQLSPCRGQKDNDRAIFRTPEYRGLNDRKIGIGEEIATSSAAPVRRRLTRSVGSIF